MTEEKGGHPANGSVWRGLDRGAGGQGRAPERRECGISQRRRGGGKAGPGKAGERSQWWQCCVGEGGACRRGPAAAACFFPGQDTQSPSRI